MPTTRLESPRQPGTACHRDAPSCLLEAASPARMRFRGLRQRLAEVTGQATLSHRVRQPKIAAKPGHPPIPRAGLMRIIENRAAKGLRVANGGH
jgi:hypothetical protein